MNNLKNMKLALLILSVTLSSQIFGFEVEKHVVARTTEFKAKIMTRKLVDLESIDSYDGKFFKIVFKKSEQAISFYEYDSNIQLKAATAYYHLNKARKYFVEVLNSEFVKSLPKLTVRIDIINKFSELGHFAHDNLDPQFNNALSIPTGLGYPERGIGPWDNEIWFRPSKKIHISEFSNHDREKMQLKYILRGYRNQTHMVSFQNFLSKLLLGDAWSASNTTVSNVMRLAGTSVIIEGIFRFTDIAVDIFKQKYYRLDSALVPEIIYHEFAHVALSDHLAITHSSPVNEGMADYFAGKIANSKQLATRIKDYNLFSGKKVRKKQMYRYEFESQQYANADFVFGLLYEAEKIAGEKGPVMLYNVRTKIETDSSIRDQLLEGILRSCREHCSIPGLNHIQLLKLFHYKGI
jgi:hypothetical protein